MSLRVRLIAGVIAIAGAGLLLVGGVVYAQQRSDLLARVDDQLRAAPPALAHQLDEQQGVSGAGGGGARGDPIDEDDRGPGGRGPREAPSNLPPGTYGELRDDSGGTVTSVVLSYGQSAPAEPKLPRALPLGQIRTVGADGDSGLRYKALATRIPGHTGSVVAAVPLKEVDSTLDGLRVVEAIVIGSVLLALGGLSWVVVRFGLRPLDRMGATADAIAAGELDRRVSPATERSEVGRLGLALNQMLERLQGAFHQRERSEERLRRFIADASHELRTPLASIRGYAELYNMGGAASEEDKGKAMSRIEDEAKRMGVLVDDLLTLARLDEPHDAERKRVDLADLARDAVDDARAMDRSRAIDLEADGAASIIGDASELRQVFANLLGNAVAHSGDGAAVEVRLSSENGSVELEVRDHGRGLPDGDPETLFERFWRSERGRERGRSGSGLGLAIVAGIVDAHRGEVRASNAPGGGASFVVKLPRA